MLILSRSSKPRQVALLALVATVTGGCGAAEPSDAASTDVTADAAPVSSAPVGEPPEEAVDALAALAEGDWECLLVEGEDLPLPLAVVNDYFAQAGAWLDDPDNEDWVGEPILVRIGADEGVMVQGSSRTTYGWELGEDGGLRVGQNRDEYATEQGWEEYVGSSDDAPQYPEWWTSWTVTGIPDQLSSFELVPLEARRTPGTSEWLDNSDEPDRALAVGYSDGIAQIVDYSGAFWSDPALCTSVHLNPDLPLAEALARDEIFGRPLPEPVLP